MKKRLTEFKRTFAFFLALVMMFDINLTGLTVPAAQTGKPVAPGYTNDVYWYYDETVGDLKISTERREEINTPNDYCGKVDIRKTYTKDTIPWAGIREDVYSVTVGTAGGDDTVIPYITASWFEGMENLSSFDFAAIDFSGVVDMSNMFAGCTWLTDLDLGDFETPMVVNMSGMFKGCELLETLDISSFDTSCVEDFSSMFEGCSRLRVLSGPEAFRTEKAVTMKAMFKDCSELPSFTPGKDFTCSNVTDMSSMFMNCSCLASVDVSRFETNSLQNTASMFEGCYSLSSIDLTLMELKKVATMSSMFKDCQSLTSFILVDINSTGPDAVDVETRKLKAADHMFEGCTALKTVDFSGMNTDSLRTLNSMFLGCTALDSVKLAAFDRCEFLNDLSYLFSGCSSITEISFSLNEDSAAENVIEIRECSALRDMSHMLEDMSGLETLDLDVDMKKITNVDDMLSGLGSLEKLSLGSLAVLQVKNGDTVVSWGGLEDPSEQAGADGHWYRVQSNQVERYTSKELAEKNRQVKMGFRSHFATITYDSNGYGESFTEYLYYKQPYTVAGKDKFHVDRAAEDPMWKYGADGYIKAGAVIEKPEDTKNSSLWDQTLYIRWAGETKATYSVVWKNGETVLEKDEVKYGVVPEYNGLEPTKEPEGGQKYIFDGWDKEVTAVKADTEYNAVFADAVTITWNYDDGSLYRQNLIKKGTIPVKPADPVKETKGGIEYSFEKWNPNPNYECNYDTVFTAVFNSYSATELFWSFDAATGTLKIGKEPAAGTSAFDKDAEFDEENPAPWTVYRNSIRKVEISWNQTAETKAGPKSTKGWFEDLVNLEQADLSGLDTSAVTTVSKMFSGCGKLTSVIMTGWDTSKVTDFSYMFEGCSALTKLDVSGLDTQTAVKLDGMFADMKRVRELKTGSFDTGKVKSFFRMFDGCYYLEKADVSNFNTSKAEDMSFMFSQCSRLQTVDVSRFVTAALTKADYMFSGCSQIRELNVKAFNIGKTGFSSEKMFNGMKRLASLTTGTVTDFSKAGLPGPSETYIEGAEGLWFDSDNKAYQPDAVKGGKTYRAAYGWVEYYPNGADGKPVRENLHYSDTYYALSGQIYTRAGKVFVGWSRTAAESTEAEYKADQAIPRVSAKGVKGFETLIGQKLYAIWRNPEEKYGTVTWKNYNGTVLHTSKVLIGTKPVYTWADPTRSQSEQYTYTFKGWDKEITVLKEDTAEYTAEYDKTVRTYTITWKNGTQVLEVDYNVPYGDTPVYNGNTPVKLEDETYVYVFSGWYDPIHPVTGNETYVAGFTPIKKPVVTGYTVTWLQDDQSLLGLTFVDIGQMPSYGKDPVKESNAVYNYYFKGWTPTLEPVTKDATYTAEYNAVKRIYSVTYNSMGHGNLGDVIRRERVDSLLTKPTDPQDASYTFLGWYTEITCEHKVDFGTYTMPAKDITLYAAWKKNEEKQPISGGGGGGGGVIKTSTLNEQNKKGTYSPNWFTGADGKWMIADGNGVLQKNCWLCDDAVASNRCDTWYLLKEDGTMLDAGLVQDLTGNYYSLEMRHQGYYGMLRHENGWYDGIWLEFEQAHNGSFGAIKNKEGIEALKAKYGVTKYNIGNESCVYTSTFD